MQTRYLVIMAMLIVASAFASDSTLFSTKPPVFKLNRAVEGILFLTPMGGDAPSELIFKPKSDSALGIKRAKDDHRTQVFIWPEEPILSALKISDENRPSGDFCWQWNATLKISEYQYGHGYDVGFDIADGQLIQAKNFKKACNSNEENKRNRE